MSGDRGTVLHSFCAVPAAAMRAPSINKEGRVLMAVSKAVENGTGVAVISQERIVALTGLSRRSVNAALTNLEADGVLTIHDRGRRERGCYKVKAYALDYTAPADHGGPVDAPREDGVHMEGVENPSPMGTRGSHGPCEDGVHTSMGTPGSQLPDRLSPDPLSVPDPAQRRRAGARESVAAADGHDDAGQDEQAQASASAEMGSDGMQADHAVSGDGGGDTPPTLPMVRVKAVEGATPTKRRAKQLRGGGWKALINRDQREGKHRIAFLDAEASDECQRRVHQNNEDAELVLIQLADAAKRAGAPKWRPWCGMVDDRPAAEPAAHASDEPTILAADDPNNDRPDPTDFMAGAKAQERAARTQTAMGGTGEPVGDAQGRAFKGTIFQEWQAAQHRADAALKRLMQDSPSAGEHLTAQHFHDAAVEEVYEPGCADEMFRNILKRMAEEAGCHA